MNRRKIFLESVSQLGLTKNQLNGVVSLFEALVSDGDNNANDDFEYYVNEDGDEICTRAANPADVQAFHNVEKLFESKNGQPSKIMSMLNEAWDEELSSCGIDIEKESEFDHDRYWPNINVIFSYTEDWKKGTKGEGRVNIRANEDGKLSYVLFDRHGRNMNPYLYRFEGTDINQFEDPHYEVSPRYDITQIKDFLEEVTSKILIYSTTNHDFLMDF